MSGTLYFAYPGDLQARTGGYGYDRRLVAELGHMGWDVRLLPLGSGFPDIDPQRLSKAAEVLDAVPDGALVLVDGLAFGVLDEWAARRHDDVRLLALVHHPLALETGLPATVQEEYRRREKHALSFVRGAIVTSAATARELEQNYGLSQAAIAIASPGTDPAPLAGGSGDIPAILSVGSLIRRKGHDVLIDALAMLRDLSWTCRIVGSRALDPAAADALEAQILAAGLADRIALVGEVEDVRTEYMRADVFALASRYEGYGMVFAEALVHGLPIVGCAAGAVPDVVPEGTGLLVPPDDPRALSKALRRVLTDTNLRSAMADAAAVGGASLPSWRETAAVVARFLEERG
ncbi:glycosyltransferase family 1 protein [Pseudorhizobium endolithicum]|uniref:Glycosyltransferase family 1 protein n=1 Tax=Pseudorhizobium endolithicum TaxID=1191678 RepID=A0ABM8PN51_9HYPH|nr:glycosyltransferase family 4 protein [Pseudorhizobium endolithicum]CAD7038967.1 glycosyltransferase family 1 protein [Pseudorhizobium endolithicum]